MRSSIVAIFPGGFGKADLKLMTLCPELPSAASQSRIRSLAVVGATANLSLGRRLKHALFAVDNRCFHTQKATAHLPVMSCTLAYDNIILFPRGKIGSGICGAQGHTEFLVGGGVSVNLALMSRCCVERGVQLTNPAWPEFNCVAKG